MTNSFNKEKPFYSWKNGGITIEKIYLNGIRKTDMTEPVFTINVSTRNV